MHFRSQIYKYNDDEQKDYNKPYMTSMMIR